MTVKTTALILATMRVLFAGRYDWANVSNRVARGMNAAAGERVARVFTTSTHPFGYVEDAFGSRDELHDWARGIDWLISSGDGDYTAFELVRRSLPMPAGVRFAAAHVGSAYRSYHGTYNAEDAAMGFAVRFIGGDLYRFAEHDPKAVPYFAPPATVLPEILSLPGPVRICHSPSSRATKGTSYIVGALAGLELDIIEKVPFEAVTGRRAKAHIFVDQLNPEIGGFGASAVEAMGVGCAVLADIRHVSRKVADFYPSPPIINVATQAELRNEIDKLIEDRARLEILRGASLRWARDVAGPEAVGRYWLQHLA